VARAAADAAAHSFEIQLQQTYAPCVTLALMVQQAPQWNDLKPLFHQLAPPLLNQVCGAHGKYMGCMVGYPPAFYIHKSKFMVCLLPTVHGTVPGRCEQ
jgi:hypothetical protein